MLLGQSDALNWPSELRGRVMKYLNHVQYTSTGYPVNNELRMQLQGTDATEAKVLTNDTPILVVTCGIFECFHK